jgi:lactose/L-arabinose transport system permease protein
LNGWLFVGPALTLIGLFMIYPILRSLWLSLYSGKGMVMKFAGTGNIVRLTNDPVFLKALTNTITYFVIQVPIMILLALVLAAALNAPTLKFSGFFRTAIFLPCVSSLIAYSILFKSMFALDGVVNSSLQAIGLIATPISWFTEPFWAKTLVIIAITWRWTGYNMIFYLAAMQNIDKSIYEAARIDGVPTWARFFYITVPMLKPVILFTTVTSTIGTLQLFDEVYSLSAEGKGGPADSTLTLSLYIYNLTFRYMPSYGYAATVSYVIVTMVAILAFLQFYAARERK